MADRCVGPLLQLKPVHVPDHERTEFMQTFRRLFGLVEQFDKTLAETIALIAPQDRGNVVQKSVTIVCRLFPSSCILR